MLAQTEEKRREEKEEEKGKRRRKKERRETPDTRSDSQSRHCRSPDISVRPLFLFFFKVSEGRRSRPLPAFWGAAGFGWGPSRLRKINKKRGERDGRDFFSQPFLKMKPCSPAFQGISNFVPTRLASREIDETNRLCKKVIFYGKYFKKVKNSVQQFLQGVREDALRIIFLSSSKHPFELNESYFVPTLLH